MLWIRSGQPLNTFEKQAPMCTFGVGGSPFDTGFGCDDDVDDEEEEEPVGGVGEEDGRLPERSRLRRGGAFGESAEKKRIFDFNKNKFDAPIQIYQLLLEPFYQFEGSLSAQYL